MSIKVIDGNITQTTAPYICHQVNCQGRMNSGVAKAIRERFPDAYHDYITTCRNPDRGHVTGLLGTLRITAIPGGPKICHMFAQDRYGYDGQRYTNYDAFFSCLNTLAEIILRGSTIAMPYGIGCGLGGGDWDVIYPMIESVLGQDYTVELWRLQK